MNIVKFPECNVTYAENQPEYRPLPALKMEDGEIVTCWKPSIRERLKILFSGKIWLNVLTFNKPLQPLLISANKPFQMDGVSNVPPGPADYPRPKNHHPVG